MFHRLVLIVIPIMMLFSYELITSRDSAHQIAATESANITKIISGKLSFILDEAVSDLNVVAATLPLRYLQKKASGQDKKQIEAMLINQLHGFRYISAIRVFAANGDLYYSSNNQDLISINIADRDHFKVHRDNATSSFGFSEVMRARTTNK